jgi:hypothetical protein
MDTLSSILGKKITEQASKTSQAQDDGDGPRQWPTLPLDREFRVKVLESTVGTLASGAAVLNLTLSVVDPGGEFDGRRVWDSWFYTGVEFQMEKIAQLFFALGIGPDDLPQSNEYADVFAAVAPIIVERTLFVALRNQVGKDGVARSRVRYVNADRGREPRAQIKPPVDKGGAPNLTADVSKLIRSDEPEPFPAEPAPAPAPAPKPATIPASGGIRLPTSPVK